MTYPGIKRKVAIDHCGAVEKRVPIVSYTSIDELQDELEKNRLIEQQYHIRSLRPFFSFLTLKTKQSLRLL